MGYWRLKKDNTGNQCKSPAFPVYKFTHGNAVEKIIGIENTNGVLRTFLVRLNEGGLEMMREEVS